LANYFDTSFVIDGDEFRKMFVNENYEKDGRELNISRANAAATYLNKSQNKPVILCLVNPYSHLRDELKHYNPDSMQILLTSNRRRVQLSWDQTTQVEHYVKDFEVGNPDHSINTDREVEEVWKDFNKDIIGE
tara:strand:+ start:186 stop:584 length:399 start_codon:yes stop_codon:yes gene_type:complete